MPVYTFEWDGNKWFEVVLELNGIQERQKGNYFKYALKETPICSILMKNKANLNYVEGKILEDDELELKDSKNNQLNQNNENKD